MLSSQAVLYDTCCVPCNVHGLLFLVEVTQLPVLTIQSSSGCDIFGYHKKLSTFNHMLLYTESQ
jgi:hypothetical protein